MCPSPSDAPEAARASSGRQDLTRGSIFKHMLSLTLPGALTNVLTFSTSLVDMIWLGRVSTTAIAAVSTFNYIWFLFSLLNQMIGNGSVALIARSYGSGDVEESKRILGQTFSFKVIVASVVTAIGLFFQRWMYSLFGAEGEVMDQTIIYGTIMFSFTPLLFSTFTLKTGLRAIGDMKLLLYVSAATAVINLVLDPLMIFEQIVIGPLPWLGLHNPAVICEGLGLGVAGAAWGTALSFTLVFLSCLFIYFNGKTFIRITPRHFFDINWHTAWRILRIGVPPALSDSLQNISNVFIGSAINTYGTAVFAGQGVNQMLVRLTRFTVMGIQMGCITMVGQNLGAKEPKRAIRSVYLAIGLAFVLLTSLGLLFYAFAPQIVHLFLPNNDAESVATSYWAVLIMRINVFTLMTFGLSRVILSAFQGSGDTKPALWGTLLAQFCLQLPLVLGGVYLLQIEQPLFIWWVEALAYAVSGVYLFIEFKRGRWTKKQV